MKNESARLRALVLTLLVGACSPAEGTLMSADTVACLPVESHGAVADDGQDDRAALQRALDAGCMALGPGRYDVVTPPVPRPYAMLAMPTNARIEGLGEQSVVAFSGDPMGRDWRGIQASTGARISRLVLIVDGMSADTNEQTHVVRVDGPASDISIDHVAFDHPVAPVGKRGDCVQFVGYPPGPTSPDKRITGAVVSDSEFRRCARSGIAVHSGLHGFTFSSNRFLGTADQDIDFEGSGDIADGTISDSEFRIPEHNESPIAVSIMFSRDIRFVHNWLDGRGLDLYGCDSCEVGHNRIVQAVPGAPVVQLRKLSRGVRFHHERWERAASAGPGNTLVVSQKISAPVDVRVEDSLLVQRAAGSPVSVWGIVGFSLTDSTVEYHGTDPTAIGVVADGSAGALGIRTTDLHVVGSRFVGPMRWAIRISGSYSGVGTLEVRRTTSVGPVGGLGCLDTTVGAQITGPITYTDNAMPEPSNPCLPLIAP